MTRRRAWAYSLHPRVAGFRFSGFQVAGTGFVSVTGGLCAALLTRSNYSSMRVAIVLATERDSQAAHTDPGGSQFNTQVGPFSMLIFSDVAMSVAAASTAVPESSSIVLLLAAFACDMSRRRLT